MSNYRSSDVVFTICQDNARKVVDIRDLNSNAEEVLGFTQIEMRNKPLTDFLPPRIRALVNEYVEFEDDANDVGSVLSKVQNFLMLDKQGREVAFRLKIVRSEALDANSYFKLILQDKQGIKKNEAFKRVLVENFKGHEAVDASTGLPDRGSIFKDLELVLHYVNKGEVKATFAVIEIDDSEKISVRYGQAAYRAVQQHIASLARKHLRSEDTLGTLSPSRMGLILVDANLESARMVLNRYRIHIGSTPCPLPTGTPLNVTVSITFAEVGVREHERSILDDCEYAMNRQKTSNNALLEVGNIEKRGSDERRKQFMSVEFERRASQDRRSLFNPFGKS